MKTIRAVAVAFILSVVGNAQQFEQVTVRPALRGAHATKPTFHSDAVTLSAVNTGLRQLIQRAYGVEDYQIVAPSWLLQARFDLVAKFPEFATDPESYEAGIQTMMQETLAERFRLAVHKESRILPVYVMSVEKSGIRFREATPGVEHTDPVWGHYSGSKITMAALAQYLTTVVGTPVRDTTGLTGIYDVTLSFPTISAIPVALSDGLGLRLDKRKAPAEMLAVENLSPQSRPKEISNEPKQQSGQISCSSCAPLAGFDTAQARPPNADADAVIDAARKAALAFADSMPDFIVTRTTTRYRGVRNLISRNQTVMQQALILNANTDWQPLDTISGNIATDHGKEIYSNIVLNGKPAATVPARGVWSQGEFSAALLTVLSPQSAAQFLAKGRDLIKNRRAIRYGFAVDQAHSEWSLPAAGTGDGARFMPAFDGTLGG
jgi:uncharacterized protein (TIGR03435 family)